MCWQRVDHHTYVNSYWSFIENAYGGTKGDVIIGNRLGNSLYGFEGNDFLMGTQGDDALYGGLHNDTYFYRFGDGSDTILEALSGGFDRLVIDGMHNFDDLADDLRFRRNGKDLLISLSLDGRDDAHAEQIKITRMHHGRSRIERLDLKNVAGWFGHISLPSVWSQATGQWQRFRPIAGNDNFGQLVAPV